MDRQTSARLMHHPHGLWVAIVVVVVVVVVIVVVEKWRKSGSS